MKRTAYLASEWLDWIAPVKRRQPHSGADEADVESPWEGIRQLLVNLAGGEANFEAALAFVEADLKTIAERQKKKRATIRANGKRALERIRRLVKLMDLHDRGAVLEYLSQPVAKVS